MAIIRCPYCHAIIDETAKYCNNCGTQLLFPDDETLEEEIPGEKILDADVEEKDYELDEPEEEPVNLEEEEDAEETRKEESGENIELEDVAEEEEREAEEEESEERGEDRIETRDLDAGPGAGLSVRDEEEDREAARESPGEAADGGYEKTEPTGEFDKTEEGLEGKTPTGELEETEEASVEGAEEEVPGTGPVRADEEHELVAKESEEPAPAGPEPEAAADLEAAEVEYIKDTGEPGEPVISGGPAPSAPAEDETATVEVAAKAADTFDTRDLDKIGRTVDLGKEKVDRFLEVMAEKEKEAVEEDEEPSGPRPPEKADTGGTLPPWADAMVGVPSFESGEKTDSFPPEWEDKELTTEGPTEEEEIDEEPPEEKTERILPRRRASDSGIGLPERLTQPALPFGETPGEGELGDEAPAGEREPFLPRRRRRGGPEFPGPGAVEREADRVYPPFNLMDFAKAKVFDCLFVAVFWLVTSWFAARSLGGTLFRLFSSAGGLLLAFYFTLLVMYFFLFQFFLGETLGDRLFRKKG